MYTKNVSSGLSSIAFGTPTRTTTLSLFPRTITVIDPYTYLSTSVSAIDVWLSLLCSLVGSPPSVQE